MPKTCTKCGERKPVSEFRKHSKTKSGLDSWCKACHRVAGRAYYDRHKENRPPKPLLTTAQIDLIRLIARGLDVTEIAAELSITRESVKARCKRIETILGVRRLREIPYAYYLKTGLVPFGSSEFEGRSGLSLSQVVEEMFNPPPERRDNGDS